MLATILGPMFLADPRDPEQGRTTMLVLLGIQLTSYMWYAVAAGAAAKVLSDAGWKLAA